MKTRSMATSDQLQTTNRMFKANNWMTSNIYSKDDIKLALKTQSTFYYSTENVSWKNTWQP